jgi:hypothetical protein
MCLVDDPDERFEFPPAACCGCGAGLAGEPVAAQRRRATCCTMFMNLPVEMLTRRPAVLGRAAKLRAHAS